MIDMLLLFVYCKGNGFKSCRVCNESSLNFAIVERRLRETDMFALIPVNYIRTSTVHIEDDILNRKKIQNLATDD